MFDEPTARALARARSPRSTARALLGAHAPRAHGSAQRIMATAEGLARMGSWELDLSSHVSTWSDGMYRIHGYEPGSFEPGLERLIELLHPEDRERTSSLLASVLDNPARLLEEEVRTEYRVVRPDGSIREVRARGLVEPDERGEPALWLGAAQDVTDQRLTERQLRAHHAVQEALGEWESPAEAADSLLPCLGTALDFPLGAFWTWDRRLERLVCRSFWTADGVDGERFESLTRAVPLAAGAGGPGHVWLTGEPMLAYDSDPLLRPERRGPAGACGVRTGLAFPAMGPHGPLAVVSYYSFERRAPEDRLITTLAGIGAELGRFLAQRQAELGQHLLSPRELEVLQLSAEGYSGPGIADQLVVKPATIKTHFENIYEKLGVGDRAAAVAHGFRNGLIR